MVTAKAINVVQVDLVRPVGFEQHRCGVAEPQAFLHGALRDPEAVPAMAFAVLPSIGQAAERLDLIGRVHGGADTVLGQRNFFGRHDTADHAAGHEAVVLQASVPSAASACIAANRRPPAITA